MIVCELIIQTFIVTAIWDIILRKIVENYKSMPKFVQSYKFLVYLKPYFEMHTLLAAALIAGFVGAITQYIILSLYKFPNNSGDIPEFLLISFIISALFGFIMKMSKLFPHLDATYYKNLGPINGALHDGISGLIVQITLLFINY